MSLPVPTALASTVPWDAVTVMSPAARTPSIRVGSLTAISTVPDELTVTVGFGEAGIGIAVLLKISKTALKFSWPSTPLWSAPAEIAIVPWLGAEPSTGFTPSDTSTRACAPMVASFWPVYLTSTSPDGAPARP